LEFEEFWGKLKFSHNERPKAMDEVEWNTIAYAYHLFEERQTPLNKSIGMSLGMTEEDFADLEKFK
jgi:hypothetical protein